MPLEGLANDRVVVRAGTTSLDSGLQFHRVLLLSGFWCSGFASLRASPKRQLTNDGVVVASELSSLDFGLEFHYHSPSRSDV